MESPNSVLIVVTQQLGDVLLATPLLQALRQRWPDARIDVLGFAGTLKLLEGNPLASSLIEAPRGGWRANWSTIRRLWKRYDLALITQSGDRAMLYGLVAARTRSALLPRAGAGRWWKRLISRHHVDGDPDRHTVLDKLELAAPWLPMQSLELSVVPPRALPLDAATAAALQPRYVVVHVPSMMRYKQWPTASYRQVVTGLVERGLQVVLTGDASASDQRLVGEVAAGLAPPAVLNVAGQLGLGQVTTLLQSASAYLGPDASVTHLAAAVGTPIVSVFGPTSPRNWGPWPAGHPARQPWQPRGDEPGRVQRVASARSTIVLMQGPSLPGQDCVPCRRAGCDDHRDSRSACLEGLDARRVLDELLALVEASNAAPLAGRGRD